MSRAKLSLALEHFVVEARGYVNYEGLQEKEQSNAYSVWRFLAFFVLGIEVEAGLS